MLNQRIQVACLPTTLSYAYPTPNQPSWAIGWGDTSENGQPSQTLKNIRLSILDPKQYCQYVSRTNFSLNICSGNINSGIGKSILIF